MGEERERGERLVRRSRLINADTSSSRGNAAILFHSMFAYHEMMRELIVTSL